MPALAAIHILVVLAASPDARTATPSLEHALHAALGPDAVVSIRSGTGETESDLALESARDNEDLVAVIESGDDPNRVRIHFFRPRERHWGDREIRFDASDPPSERGRTLGFALASMIPEPATRSEAAPTEPMPSPPAAAELPDETERPPPTTMPEPRRHSIEIVGLGAVAFGGNGGGVGGLAAARFGLSRNIALRVAGGARVAEVPVAQATSRTYFGAAGIAWSTGLDEARRWRIGGRIDGLVLGHDIVHLSSDDPEPVHHFRLLPGAAAAVEGSWRVAEQAFVVAAVGSEVAFGSSDVFVHQRKVAEVVPVRGFLETGLRIAF